MSAPVEIDLGELPRGQPPEPDPPRPVRERLRWLPERLSARAAGVVLALALVAATGASSPLQPPLALRFAVDDASVALADQQNVYVVSDSGESDEIAITAYRLEDGTVQWETSLPGNPEAFWLSAQDGALLAFASPSDYPGDPASQTTRLDPDSGETLWTQSGRPAGGDQGRVLLLSQALPGADEEYPLHEATVVDLATGQLEWTIETTAWSYAIADDPPTLVTMHSDGEVTSYDLATGGRLASATEAVQPSDGVGLAAIGSIVLVTTFQADRPVLTAYEPASLTRRWTVTDLPANHGISVPMACGPAICLSDGSGERAIDPATGETVWSTAWMPASDEPGYTDVYDPGAGPLAGHLWLTRSGGPEDRSWLLDADTGEPVLELGAWTLRLAYWGSAMDGATAVPVLRSSVDGPTWVGELRPDLSGVEPLMPLEAADPDSCLAHPPYVVCGVTPLVEDELGRVEVWRVR